MSISAADRARAEQLHEQGVAVDDEDAALALYREALALDPQRASTHYNVGLIYKYRNQWPASLESNRRAVELDPDDEASRWNLAIAATALRDWQTARGVWHGLGFGIDPGDAPIEADFGRTPVRLDPQQGGEVVWGRRIDPVRVRIDNIPFADSGFRCGDIVLHDGAEVGQRTSEGRIYSVFNVLELFEPSLHTTFEAEVRASRDADIAALVAALEAADVMNEDWTTNVRVLCRQCSEGIPHDHDDTVQKAERSDRHVIGISAQTGDAAEKVLRDWVRHGRAVLRFEPVLTPPVRH